MAERTFAYSVDRDDAVASVSDDWLAFARDNRASELSREYVLGQPLWRFIAGEETRLLYRDLFDRVRTGGSAIEIPIRCDSPDRFRFMRLVMAPGPDDSLELECTLVREQERPFFSILDRAFPRSDSSIEMCSLCKSVLAPDGEWLELEEAIRALDLFGSDPLPEIEQRVCGGCAALGRERLGGAAAG